MNRNLPTFNEAEERNKLSHFTTQGFDLNGIVQAGANDGEEMENAVRLGVDYYIAFEPLKSAFRRLLKHDVPTTYARIQLGLHDKDTTADLQVTDIDGKGSSIYETVWDHPEVLKNWNQGQAAIVGTEKIKLVRFDEWFKKMSALVVPIFIDEGLFNINNFDTLQLDTQGNEMEILKGMGEYLKNFKYLCIELSVTPVYKGETPGSEVAKWLDTQGFTLDSPIYEHNDCFFVRKDIKPESDQTYKGRC